MKIQNRVLSDGLDYCNNWKSYYLIWFRKKGYCLVSYNKNYVISDAYKDSEHLIKRYVESEAIPSRLKEDDAAYEELVKYVDIYLERYYKFATDGERWKSEEESPNNIIDELLKNIEYHAKETNNINSLKMKK